MKKKPLKKSKKKVKTIPFHSISDLYKLNDKELRQRLNRMPVHILLREHMLICEDLGALINKYPEDYHEKKEWSLISDLAIEIREEIMYKYHSVMDQIETVDYFNDIGY